MAVRHVRKTVSTKTKAVAAVGAETGAFTGVAQDGPARKARPVALAEELCARGCQYLENGIFEDAENEFHKALKMAPQYAEALNNLGLTLLYLERPQEACATLEETLAIFPGWGIAEANLALALQRQDKHAEAVHYYQQAVAHQQRSPQIYLGLGDALAASNRPDEAVAAYQQAVTQAPNYALAHMRMGQLLARRGKVNEAENALLRATQLDPDLSEAQSLMGAIAARRGNFQAAKEYFARIRTEPVPPSAQRGSYRIAALEAAAERGLAEHAEKHGEPRPLSECYFDLGLALLGADKRNEARDAFRKAAQCEPERSEFQIFGALLLMLDGQAMEARHALEKALELEPDNGSAVEQLGYLALGMGLTREATVSFQRAKELGREIPPELLQEA